MNIRHIEPEDCKTILAVASNWWGSNYSSDMFSKWYIHHFRDTCHLAEENGKMIGFIMGFLSQSESDESYIRIVMVIQCREGKVLDERYMRNFLRALECWVECNSMCYSS